MGGSCRGGERAQSTGRRKRTKKKKGRWDAGERRTGEGGRARGQGSHRQGRTAARAPRACVCGRRSRARKGGWMGAVAVEEEGKGGGDENASPQRCLSLFVFRSLPLPSSLSLPLSLHENSSRRAQWLNVLRATGSARWRKRRIAREGWQTGRRRRADRLKDSRSAATECIRAVRPPRREGE